MLKQIITKQQEGNFTDQKSKMVIRTMALSMTPKGIENNKMATHIMNMGVKMKLEISFWDGARGGGWKTIDGKDFSRTSPRLYSLLF